jgi:hypothetical protein
MVYIVENMVKPHDRFTADKEEDSVRELFDRLEEVHLAPVAQASYKVKVEAVFKCLDGSAKESVVGFKGAATRAEYLELWKDLFRQFGNKAHDVARQFRSITGASPKSTDPADIMKYMNTLKNAAVQLKRLEHPHDQVAGMVWNSLRETLPTHVAEYCRRKVDRFDEDFGSDVATWHSINGLAKFDAFYAYVLAYTITEASLRTEKTVLANKVEKKNPEDSKEESVMKVSAQKTPSASGLEDDGPPSKKKKDESDEDKKKEFGKAKDLGQVEVCFLCKCPAHIWQDCLMLIDGRVEVFRREGRCTKCAKKGHSSEDCRTKGVCCETCKDSDNKNTHHSAICFIRYGWPTRGRGARGSRSQRGGRGGQGRGRGNPSNSQGQGNNKSNNQNNNGNNQSNRGGNSSKGGRHGGKGNGGRNNNNNGSRNKGSSNDQGGQASVNSAQSAPAQNQAASSTAQQNGASNPSTSD